MTTFRGLGACGIGISLLLGCASAPGGEAENDESVASISQALTSGEVLGFESVAAWSATSGVLASSTDRVEGNASLSVSNASFTTLTSAPLAPLTGLSATGSVSVKLPTSQPNPWWLGQLDLRVDSPSRGIYGQSIAHYELTGKPLGSWQELSFTLSPNLLTSLSASGANDIRFKLDLNVPSGSQAYLFDALELGGGENQCEYHAALGGNAKKVHLVYLVPSDKTTQAAYVEGLERGAKNLQSWWKKTMGNGKTFSLASPLVEVFQTNHDSAWYNRVRGTQESTLDYYYNMMDDAAAFAGASSGDPDNVWLVYLDAQPRCGSITGALATYAGFPANDLRGLAGLSTVPVCPGDAAEGPMTCRWVGGMGHELGHTVGLPHPVGCEPHTASCPNDALMWWGYTSYPTATFTSADLTTLNASPFIATETAIPTTSCDCSEL
ncbi:MAG: hypothetical protein K0R38_4756 [Polyangiaceae bacterium]|jgi:hypothetical protein|nr:hypothetical protein [Polyangiaceae bacterium]